MLTQEFRLSVIPLVLVFALAAQASRFDLELAVGHTSSSAPSLMTEDSASRVIEETVGGRFSGTHVTATLGIRLSRWLSVHTSISGAFETGIANHPSTTWRPSQSQAAPFPIPGSEADAQRKTYALLSGIRVQDRDNPRRLNPWTYAQVGWAIKYLELEKQGQRLEEIFYPDDGIIHAGIAMAFGMGADVKVFRGLGLRAGLEYQPILALDEHSLNLHEGRWFDGNSYASRQYATFPGGLIHQWRVMIGPRIAF